MKYRLGYCGRYWTVAFALSLFLSFFVCAIAFGTAPWAIAIVPLILYERLDLFSYPGNSIFLTATTTIFSGFLALG